MLALRQRLAAPLVQRGMIWEGYKAAIPLMVGVAPFGVVYGALAVSAGLSLGQTLGMSVLVLAGSSQFVAAELIREHSPALIVVLTTFVINLRHLLYSTSLADFYRPLSLPWKLLIGYLMVDEVYAVAIAYQQQHKVPPTTMRWYFLGAASNLVSIWWLSSIIGALIGNVLPADTTTLLGFTLPLIFTAIVVPLLRKQPLILAALAAAAAGILLNPLPHKLGLILAALVGIMVGMLSEGWGGSSRVEAAIEEAKEGSA